MRVCLTTRVLVASPSASPCPPAFPIPITSSCSGAESATGAVGSPGLGAVQTVGRLRVGPLGPRQSRILPGQGHSSPPLPSAAAAAGRKGREEGREDRESERAGEHRTGGSGSTLAPELTGGSAAADRAVAPPRARGIPTPTPHTPAWTRGAQPLPPPSSQRTHTPSPPTPGLRLGPTGKGEVARVSTTHGDPTRLQGGCGDLD